MQYSNGTQVLRGVRRAGIRFDSALMYFVIGLALLLAQGDLRGEPEAPKDISQQIAEIMSHAPGATSGHRFLHAKGVVCQGTFSPSADAPSISRAAHFLATTAVTVRLSDSSPDPALPDSSPQAAPRGMAIRFKGARETDIVANSHNGFIVGNAEDFLALVKAQAATDPSKPHPWPIETFMGGHPNALKFVQDPKPTPASFATESFFGNNAFNFVNKKGLKQTGRYQIIPVAGAQYLDDAEAKTKSTNFLFRRAEEPHRGSPG